MPHIYALANQKGGVGKTTTAINLGAYLAARSQRVLLVDIDPQANATSSLGFDKNASRPSIYDCLLDATPMAEVINLTNLVRLDLVPSSPALAGAEVELVSIPEREHLLRRALAPLLERYDYILVDCPPSLGLLTINALTAADSVLIPVQCEYLALEGLSQLTRTIELVRQGLNPRLKIAGLLLTMYDSRTHLAQQVADQVRQHFGERVFRALIPRSVRLSEAPSYGEPISTYAPRSPGALAYEAVVAEMLNTDVPGARL